MFKTCDPGSLDYWCDERGELSRFASAGQDGPITLEAEAPTAEWQVRLEPAWSLALLLPKSRRAPEVRSV